MLIKRWIFCFLCDWENVNLQKEGKEKEKKKVSGADNMAADVAQQEHSNNKCCASVFFFFLRERERVWIMASPSHLWSSGLMGSNNGKSH